MVDSIGDYMNVWIFQDQPGKSMAELLQMEGVGCTWVWNVDRYVQEATTPHIQQGDIVLQWQPYLSQAAPAGIYAQAEVRRAPYCSLNEKSHWQTDVQITHILPEPLPLETIKATRNTVLLDMLIVRMPGGHIVFPVRPVAWSALQQLL